MTTLDQLVVELKADISGLQGSLRKATADIQNFEGSATRSTANVEASGRRMGLVVGGAFVATGAAAITLGKSLYAAGASIQALQGRMVAATGSATASADSFAFLRSETQRLGLRFNETANGFAGFAAAGLRAGLSMQEVRDVFTGVTEAAVAFRLSNADTQGVLLALSQMASKGVVSMEELRQQLGERLPIAMEAAARGMGVTQAELFKMIEAGDVTAKEFLPAFGKAIRENLGDAVKQGSTSAQAQLNRLGNAFEDLKAKAANGEFMSEVAGAAENMAKTLSSPAVQEGLASIARLLGDIVRVAAEVVGGLGIMANKVREFFGDAEARREGIAKGLAVGPQLENYVNSKKLQQKVVANYKGPAPSGTSDSSGLLLPPNSSNGYEASGGLLGGAGSYQEDAKFQVQTVNSSIEPLIQAETAKQEALAEVRNEYRAKELEWCTEHDAMLASSNIDLNDSIIENERRSAQARRSIQNELGNNILGLMNVFASKNKAIAIAMIAFDKARAIAQAIMETHVAAAAALKYDPTGATSAYVTSLGYANVAAIAATGIAQIATMGVGGGGSASGGGGGGYTTGDYNSGITTSSNTPSKNVLININGSDDAIFNKRQIRMLIEQVNDAIGDGSRLTVGIA